MGFKLEHDDPLKLQMQSVLQTQEAHAAMRRQQQLSAQELAWIDQVELEQQMAVTAAYTQRVQAWEADQMQYREQQMATGKNDKALAKAKTPEAIAQLREERRQKALKADKKKVRSDKTRHGFYKAVMGFVKAGRRISGADSQERNTQAEPTYEVPGLQERFAEADAQRKAADDAGRLEEFDQAHGTYYADVRAQHEAAITRTSEEAEAAVRQRVAEEGLQLTAEEQARAVAEKQAELLGQATYTMTFSNSQRSNVEGGTKPNAIRYAKDGSRWLVKTNHSCIGAAAPNASIMTVAGYKVQNLVHPETAIEAFETKSTGLGTVSMQRMADNVLSPSKGEVVDLFKFSRTPEALTARELKEVQELSPQLLREHTTDWLLANFDTKGENFIISQKPDGERVLRGIDKEAGGRAILDKGAQHMSKDYQKFDQDTVYNQLFRKFADGSMDLDLSVVEAQVLRVEQCSDQEYMDLFAPYLARQQMDRPEQAPEIAKNLLRRKQNLRSEYRRFFGELVKERMTHVSPEEAEALKARYLGGVEDGIFLFQSDTPETMQAERRRPLQQREEEREALEAQINKADKEDEKRYNRRHALYDFSKGFVMGIKSLKKSMGFDKVEQERRTTTISSADLQFDMTDLIPQQAAQVRAYRNRMEREKETYLIREKERLTRLNEGSEAPLSAEEIEAQALAHYQTMRRTSPVELTMIGDGQISMGGTKPMSQYIAADGSKWLAKQAVNCMGYKKVSGALLTEIGAKMQDMVDHDTAVEAFVGETQKHGLVSFQRKLRNVEGGDNKLDLFKFSRHPELASLETIGQVEELMPQVLREHVTDWLLCNFDTKGENFVITRDGPEAPRVLHGIDKEAAFNNINKPDAQHMSTTYRPHANNTLYNVVFEKFAAGEMDFDLRAVIPYVQKITAMGNEAYMETFTPYLEHLRESKSADEVQTIHDRILARKQNLQQEYITFFTQLIERRCKMLHPHEAQELRERYLGEDGQFRFAAPVPEDLMQD